MTELMLSAVVTCYMDEPAIPQMHERLSRVFTELGVAYEIIFVDDASPDDAGRVLRDLSASDERVLVVEHSRNFGSQSAFLSGMQVARGHAVILLDGDLQDPPELIFEFYRRWRAGDAVVYGRRGKREGSVVLQMMARAFYKAFRRLSDVEMPLDAGDFSLMDRRVVDAILELPEKDQFLRGLRSWVGFRQSGVDYLRPERPFGRSTHSFLKNVWWARKGIFSFATVPIEILTYVAVSLTLTSIAAALGCAGVKIVLPDRPLGVWPLVIVVAFFGSLNLLAVALLGEYVIKILEEAKGRPHFVRRAIVFRGRRLETREAMDRFLGARKPTEPFVAGYIDGEGEHGSA